MLFWNANCVMVYRISSGSLFLFASSQWKNETHPENLSSFIRIFFFTSSTSIEWRVEIASFGRLEDFRKQWTNGVQWSPVWGVSNRFEERFRLTVKALGVHTHVFTNWSHTDSLIHEWGEKQREEGARETRESVRRIRRERRMQWGNLPRTRRWTILFPVESASWLERRQTEGLQT